MFSYVCDSLNVNDFNDALLAISKLKYSFVKRKNILEMSIYDSDVFALKLDRRWFIF